MGNFRDTVQVRVEVEGQEAINSLSKIEFEAAQIGQEMKKLTQLTEEYALKSKRLKEVEAILNQNKQKAAELKAEYTRLKAEGQDYAQVKAAYQAVSNEIRTQTQEVRTLKSELSKMGKGSEEYKNLKNRLEQVNLAINEQRQAIGLNAMSYKQLGTYVRQLQKDWENSTPDTANHKALGQEILNVKARMNQLRPAITETKTAWQKFNDEIRMMKDMAFGNIFGELAVRGFDFLYQKIVSLLDVAGKLSDQLTDIEKKSKLDDVQVKQLNTELGGIDTRTSTSDLRDTATIGASLGYGNSVEELKAFTVEMDKINVALGDEFTGGVKESSRAIGTLKQIFKETKDMEVGTAFQKIGSAINGLGNIGSATAPEMADFAKRIGALGNLAPSISQTLGLGAALIELGLSSEIASGGVTSIIMEAGKTKNLDAFAKQIGVTKEEFKKLLDENPNEMLLQLSKSFQGLDNSQVIAGLERMGIGSQEAVKVMELLANQTEFLNFKQKESEKLFKEGTSTIEEFNKKNENLAAQIDKANKAISEFEGSVSQGLQPTMMALLTGFVAFLGFLKETPKLIKDLSPLIIGLAGSYLTFNFALIKSTTAEYAAITAQKIKLLWTERTIIAQRALNLVMTQNPIGRVIQILFLLGGALGYAYNKSETFRNVVHGVWQVLKVFGEYVAEVAETLWNLSKVPLDTSFQKIFGRVYQIAKDYIGGIIGLMKGIFTFDLDLILESSKKIFKALYDYWIGSAVYLAKKIKDNFKIGFESDGKAQRDAFLKDGAAMADDAAKRRKQQIEAEKAKNKALSEEDKKRIADNKKRAAELGGSGGGGGVKAAKDDSFEKELEKLKDFQKKVADLEGEFVKKQRTRQEQEIFDTSEKYQKLTAEIKNHLEKLEKDEKISSSQKIKIRQDYFAQIAQIELLEQRAIDELLRLQNEENFLKRLEDQKRQAQELADLGNQGLAQMSQKDEAKANIDNFFASDLDKALAENDKKYKALIAQAHEFGLDTKSLLELQGFEIQAISAKFAQSQLADNDKNLEKKLEWKRKELEALKNFELEQATQNRENKKQSLLDEGFSEDSIVKLNLLESEEAMLANIRAKYRQIELDETKKLVDRKNQLREEDFKAASTIIQNFSDITGSMFEVLGADVEASADLMKAFRLFQIGLDTAAAISSLTGASEANPANWATSGVAGIIQFTAGLARIFANIGQAKKYLNTPKPKANKKAAKGGIFDGASHNEGGMTVIDNKTKEPKVEVEGGEPFLVLSKNTYGNNKSLIDTLLYNSMYRDGAAVMPNMPLISKATTFKMAQGGLVGTLPKLDETPKNTDELALLMQIANGINTLVSLYSQKATQQQTQNLGKYEILKVLQESLDDFGTWKNDNQF